MGVLAPPSLACGVSGLSRPFRPPAEAFGVTGITYSNGLKQGTESELFDLMIFLSHSLFHRAKSASSMIIDVQKEAGQCKACFYRRSLYRYICSIAEVSADIRYGSEDRCVKKLLAAVVHMYKLTPPTPSSNKKSYGTRGVVSSFLRY